VRKKGRQIKQIRFRNFGPIKDGTIKVKPLTIFIGPNNAGKSYAATLIYALNNALGWKRTLPSRSRHGIYKIFFDELEKNLINLISEHFASSFDHEVMNELKIRAEQIEKIRQAYLSTVEKSINDLIAREFGAETKDLRKDGTQSFYVDFETNIDKLQIVSHGNKIRLKNLSKWEKDITVRFKNQSDESGAQGRHRFYDIKREGNIFTVSLVTPLNVFMMEKNTSERRKLELAIAELSIELISSILELPDIRFYPEEDSFYYLPAARSGILQGHKVLVANMVQLIPSTLGVSDMRFERFSGVVADFLSNIVEIDNTKKPLFNVATDFEEKIITGNIELLPQENKINLAIEYKFGKMHIPLNRSSSTVSELAPIFLFLKHLLDEGDTIIIEEPEAHLHPTNQRILAHLIIAMIRNKLNVLITTHSEILLEEINNLIKIGSLPAETRKNLIGDKNIFLNSDELSVFNFEYNLNPRGTMIRELHVDEKEGIPQDEFIRVHEELYSQYVTLSDLNAEKPEE
jgi:predicted ATPase